MINNNIEDIILNALTAKRKNDIKEEKEIIKMFLQSINKNKTLLEQANQIDLLKNNAIKIDLDIINKIFNKYLKEDILINKNDELNFLKNNMLYSKVYEKLGIILVLFDGNPYTMLELIILGILTHNVMIFSYDGYMLGTNGLFLTFIESILENNNYKKNMFQHSVNIENEEYFKNHKTINKTLIIGDNEFVSNALKCCTTEVIVSNFKNYSIYIDENIDNDLINTILKTKENIDIYIKENIDLKIKNATYVNDCDEAITLINYNNSKYSSSIFTNNKENASNFIKNINSKYVMVNTSPTLEQSLDITQENLLKEKIILMPNILNDV